MVITKITEVKVEDSGYILKFQAVPGKKEGKMRPKLIMIQDTKRGYSDSHGIVPTTILKRGYRLAAIAFNKLHI